MGIVEEVRALLDPIAKEKGYFVLDVEFKREGSEKFLRITLDKPGGIILDECAEINTRLGEILDQGNTIDEHYVLEVTSPGLDRRLKTDNDFAWAVGKRVKVTTFVPLEGKNVFRGSLIGISRDSLVVLEDGVSREIPRNKVASAKLDTDIDWSAA